MLAAISPFPTGEHTSVAVNFFAHPAAPSISPMHRRFDHALHSRFQTGGIHRVAFSGCDFALRTWRRDGIPLLQCAMLPRHHQKLCWMTWLLFLQCGIARAHQPGLSTVFVDLGSNRLTAQLTLAWQELEDAVPLDGNHDRTLSDDEFAAAKARLLRLGEGALSFESDGRMLSLKAPPDVCRDADDATGIRFQLIFELPPTQILSITSDIIAELQRGHSQILTVRRAGVTLLETVLERNKPTVELPLASSAEQKPVSPIREFLMLGIKHIVTGWDHLAFLFGLLVVGGKLRDAVKIITSFTIAHSITLALATLNIINVPSRIVEPLIAASIVYVGFENIVRDNFSKRWMLTFAFGLIHGCGFASALREMGVGTQGTSVATPLVCFNLGVEMGQLAITALMLPLIWKLKPAFPKKWLPVTSVALIIIGSYFLVDRVWPKRSSSQSAMAMINSASRPHR
jgi:hydrogenase/urease accessory protein HupE